MPECSTVPQHDHQRLSDFRLFMVDFHHRHGNDVGLIVSRRPPSEEDLMASDPSTYEFEREDEWLDSATEIDLPFRETLNFLEALREQDIALPDALCQQLSNLLEGYRTLTASAIPSAGEWFEAALSRYINEPGNPQPEERDLVFEDIEEERQEGRGLYLPLDGTSEAEDRYVVRLTLESGEFDYRVAIGRPALADSTD